MASFTDVSRFSGETECTGEKSSRYLVGVTSSPAGHGGDRVPTGASALVLLADFERVASADAGKNAVQVDVVEIDAARMDWEGGLGQRDPGQGHQDRQWDSERVLDHG